MTGCRLGGYDRGDFGFGRAKPVEVGKEHDVTISAIIERGDGMARIQGFVDVSGRAFENQGHRVWQQVRKGPSSFPKFRRETEKEG